MTRSWNIWHRTFLIAALCVVVGSGALVAPSADAQEAELGAIQIEQFEPLPDQYTNILNVATSDVLGHLVWSTGALLHYVDSPLRAVPIDGGEEKVLIESQLKAEIWAGLGLSEWFDIGLVMPLILTQSGGSAPTLGASSVEGFSPGDLRIVPRVRALPREYAGGFGIGIEAPFYVPTGDDETYNGEGFRAEPRLIFDYVNKDIDFSIAANVGYLIREKQDLHNIVNDDVFRWSLGTAIPLGVPGLQLLGSVFGSVQTSDSLDPTNLDETADDFGASPIEALGGVRYTAPMGLYASLGAGRGLNSAIGSPALRIFASIGYLPLDDDLDDDGIKDDDDSCPEKPEDIDTYEDADGCPDPDNDGDFILDIDDECPLEMEDIDGFEDENGCPDPDNDQDKILDPDDDCPLEAEDIDTFEDENGCPDPDNDKDTVLDVVDSCPLEAEDLDKFEDEDGCPEPDNDQDGFLDPEDACPLQPEVINGYKDDDGCPDKGEVKVIVKKDKIEIMDKVYFATNKAKIKKKSYDILNQVASVMRANPQLTKIRIEGHTDSAGKAKHNQDLSERRAAAVVDYLVEQGIEAERFTSAGYGEDKPIDTNETKAGKANNRRVEFTILELDGIAQPTAY